MKLPPWGMGLPGRAVPDRDDPLLGSDSRVWPTVLWLWTYCLVSGLGALGVGEAMVSVTRTVLPVSLVRLATVIGVVVMAGLVAEGVVGRMRSLTSRRT